MIFFNKISKRKTIYGIFMISFVIFLLNANSIVVHILDNNTILKEIQFSDIKTNSSVYYNIEEINITGSVFQTTYLNGWAFCETDNFSDKKTINIIFKNVDTDISYVATTLTSTRHDVTNAFPELQVNFHNSFDISFTTLNMKDGIYELYLYVHENDENYGLVNTGKKYYKTTTGLIEYASEGDISTKVENTIENFEDIMVTGEVSYNVEEVKKDEEEIYIIGWAYLEDKLSDNQQIYVQITDKSDKIYTYETSQHERGDIVTYFKDARYNYSGFSLITNDDIDLEGAKINIIIENEGLFMSSDFYYKGEQ